MICLKKLMAYFEVVAFEDIADSSQDSSTPSILASRPITTLKSQQVIKVEVKHVSYKEVYCMPMDIDRNLGNMFRKG